jgi:hypothetical protein
MAPLVYTSSMGVYSAADVDLTTGRLHEGPMATQPPTTASTRWPTRARPGSTRSTTGWRASASAR